MSKEPKWPPGPWTAYCGEDTNWWWIVNDNNGYELGSGDGGFDEASANLIAAAPDMYAALDELADLMQGVIDGDYTPDSFTLQVARAALAKARGES